MITVMVMHLSFKMQLAKCNCCSDVVECTNSEGSWLLPAQYRMYCTDSSNDMLMQHGSIHNVHVYNLLLW